MTPAQQVLSDAHALIREPQHFSTAAYVRDKQGREIYQNGRRTFRWEDKLKFAEDLHFHVRREGAAQFCMVSAIMKAAPSPELGNEALDLLIDGIGGCITDACIGAPAPTYEYLGEWFNNYNPAGHAGVLELLAVTSGNSELTS